jgi:hypothetical protein
MLPVHVAMLVLSARNMQPHGPWQLGDPWTTWNLAAPVMLLFVFGYMTRKLNDAGEEGEEAVARLFAKWTWGAAGLDVVATAVVWVLTHR